MRETDVQNPSRTNNHNTVKLANILQKKNMKEYIFLPWIILVAMTSLTKFLEISLFTFYQCFSFHSVYLGCVYTGYSVYTEVLTLHLMMMYLLGLLVCTDTWKLMMITIFILNVCSSQKSAVSTILLFLSQSIKDCSK